jgi:hypothetical protein
MRKDTTKYLGLGYRGPTSRSEYFFIFKSTQIGGYNKSERDLAGDHSVLSYGSSAMRFLPQ